MSADISSAQRRQHTCIYTRHSCDGQTDGQTHRRSMAYSAQAYIICFAHYMPSPVCPPVCPSHECISQTG